MTQNDKPNTIRSLFDEAEGLMKDLGVCADSDSDEYQSTLNAALAKYQQCKDEIPQASLFSLNESLEDLATSDMRYLIIAFNMAELNIRKKSPDRKSVLLHSMALYKEFIALCDAYDLVSSTDLTAAENAGIGKPVTVLPSDPGARRIAKISQFKLEKELKQRIKLLEQRVNGDEDDIRSYHKATTQLAIMQTVQALGMVVMELDILSRAPPTEFSYCQVEDDVRSRDSYKDGYDEKLDSIPNHIKGGALISKDGKPLRPFTLLDKRQQLKGGVFGPGHNLPTITIDEYLEEERRRGGMMEGGGEKSGERPKPNEDDYEQADRDTMKAREWDEFTEQNPRGSGNTLNRG